MHGDSTKFMENPCITGLMVLILLDIGPVVQWIE